MPGGRLKLEMGCVKNGPVAATVVEHHQPATALQEAHHHAAVLVRQQHRQPTPRTGFRSPSSAQSSADQLVAP